MVSSRRSRMKAEPANDSPILETPASQNQAPDLRDSVATFGQEDHTAGMMDATNGLDHSSQSSSAMESLGDKSRQLIQSIQKLESLRIEATLPSLPKFVVVGDQSHGKSSIVEAVCDIMLPRAAGTCTRCPFRITTTASKNGSEWRCDVTLVYRYTYNPRKTGRWEDTGNQTPVQFATVHDKAQLEAVLRFAQTAILNPGVPPGDILGGRTAPGDGVKFSPNIISLEISAPHLPELSLFDLPGTINVHPNEDEQHLVAIIEKLVKSYLRDEKALVLLAASANQDLECSLAAKLILNSKANNRSMGVLTKPDLVTSERIPEIRTVLEGGSFKLGGGWFITKHSSQEEINQGVSHIQARSLESMFFQGEPWNTELADFSDRFGIPRLQEAISHKLTQHILNDLPEIMSRVDNRLSDVKGELATFPPESGEPCLTVMSEIDSFEAHFVEQLKGEALKNEFRKRFREIFTKLGRVLADARPNVMLGTPGFKPRPIPIDSDEEMEDGSSSPEPSPAKKGKAANGHAFATPSSSDATPRAARRTPIKTEDGVSAMKKVNFTLKGIRESHEAGRASTLPELNWKVTIALIKESLAGWSNIIEGTLRSIDELIREMLQQSMETTLGGRKGTKLYEEAENVIGTFFKTLMSQQWNFVTHYLKCEQHKPVTFQVSHLNEKMGSVKKTLFDLRADARAKEYIDNYDIKINTNKPDERKKKISDIQTKLPPDEYANEIDAIGRVLGYYDLAAANLPDVVAKMLEFGLLNELQKQLKTTLRRELKALDANYCLHLLAEDPAREAQRRNLLSEQEKLEQALQELRGLSLA